MINSRVAKVFSTPANPADAILAAIQQAAPAGASIAVRHGTTVGTNTLLERKGAEVAFVTTAGFEDTIAIGRQARPSLYDWFMEPPPCLVPAGLRFGVPERTSAEGAILRTPMEQELRALREAIDKSGAEAIAISLLFSFANPANERLVAAALEPLGLPLSISHRILPEFREYERASTIVVNAYLAPKVGSYIRSLQEGSRRDVSGRGAACDAVFGWHYLFHGRVGGAGAHCSFRACGRSDWCGEDRCALPDYRR